MTNQEDYTQTTTKTMTSPFDYHFMLQHVSRVGKEMYGPDFVIADADKPVITRLLAYFMRDKGVADAEGIDLDKGIFLMGPVGCGKTALMRIMSNLCPSKDKPVFRSCNEVIVDFNIRGFEAIIPYTRDAICPYTLTPKVHCFDDLGLEPMGYYFGNSTNVMAEIMLSRYNYFITRKMLTHVTTNLDIDELEEIYGNRIRSRMREMFNRMTFSSGSGDKR